jgi:hypothetical protein
MVPIHIYSGLDIPRNKNNCCEHLLGIVYFFLVGACVRIYKILQRNATFLLVTLFFYIH